MVDFVSAVGEMQALMASSDGDDYVLSQARQREAEIVAPCAARWVIGEMDETRSLTVGRGGSIGPLGAPPSLAEKIQKRLASAPGAAAEAARTGVHKALATGYLAYCETEPRSAKTVRPERSAEDIWEFWVSGCRTMLEEVGIPKSWANTVRRMGADVLVTELKSCGLTSLLGGSKINQLGSLYAQAGVHLRIAQTDTVDDEGFGRVVAGRRADPDRPWRFHDYG